MSSTVPNETGPAAGKTPDGRERPDSAPDPATLLGGAADVTPAADKQDAAEDGAEEIARDGASGDDPPAPAARYDAFTLPDGVTADPAALEAAHALFGEARLSQAQAQKFVDFALGRELAAQQRQLQSFHDLQERWVEEVKGDRAIGGAKLTGALALAGRAIDRLGGDDLRRALDLTGAGNHPAVVRAFVTLGELLREDRFAPGSGQRPAGPRTPAERIYGAAPIGGGRKA